MASSAESTNAVDDRDTSRPKGVEPAPRAETAGEQFGALSHPFGPLGQVFSGAFSEPQGNGSGRSLFDQALSHPVNSPARSIALKRAQQTHGNHFAQDVVRGLQLARTTSPIVQRACACGNTCEKCQTESKAAFSVASSSVRDSSIKRIQAQSSTDEKRNGHKNREVSPRESRGQSLDEHTRGFMESSLGRDFSDVRVHTDSHAAASAEALGANAYTSGRDIYFAAGKYAPENDSGKRLLAHELVHTVQQADTDSFPQSASAGHVNVDPDQSLELDADRVANQIASSASPGTDATSAMRASAHPTPGRGVTVLRDPDDTNPQPQGQTDADYVEDLYDQILHLWNLRSGLGEAVNKEETEILENEDITARLVEEACAPDALVLNPPTKEGTTTPASPGLADESLLSSASPGFGFELYEADDDAIQLAKAFAYRVALLLINARPDKFEDEEDFWVVHKDLTATACSEEDTLAILGDKFLKQTWAFPRTWAKRLQKRFIPDLSISMLESARNTSLGKLEKATLAISPFLANHGLPLNLQDSLSLGFVGPTELIRILRTSSGSAGLLNEFFEAEEAALENYFELLFGRRWLELGHEVVVAVGTAHKSVNPDSFDSYSQEAFVGSLIRDRKQTNEFEAVRMHLDRLEMDISHLSYVRSMVSKWLMKRIYDGWRDKQFEIADELIRGLGEEPRLERAQDWRDEKNFDPQARSFLIENISLLDIAKEAGKDFGLTLLVGAIFGPWGVLVKEAGEALSSLNESRKKISEARDAARKATSVARLQQASANLAVIMASESLSIALTIAQVPGVLKQAKQLRNATPKGADPDAEAALKKSTTDEPPQGAKPNVPTTKTEPDVTVKSEPDVPTATDKPDVPSTKKLPYVEAEADFLARTRNTPSDKLKNVDAKRELELARTRGERRVPQEPYTQEINFNNKTWKYNGKTGKWCRFGSPQDCFDVPEAKPKTIDELKKAGEEPPAGSIEDITTHAGSQLAPVKAGGPARALPMGMEAHKAARWAEYQTSGGTWPKARWDELYDRRIEIKRAEIEKEATLLEARQPSLVKNLNNLEDMAAAAKLEADRLASRAAIAKGDTKTALDAEAKQARAAYEEASKQATAARQDIVDTQIKIKRLQAQLNLDERSRLPCFAESTMVWTPTGPRAIQELKINDLVLACDLNSFATVTRQVLEVHQNQTMRFYHLDVDGQTIRATSQHRFWVESENEWIETRNLRVGMELRLLSGQPSPIRRIDLREAPFASTYNLHIDQSFTYFVGPGVLVHNNGPSYNFGNFRIYVAVNPNFPGYVYIGQTDDLVRRQREHRAEAEEMLKRSDLTKEQREFWQFKRDLELNERVSGLNADQANYLEQKNITLERDATRATVFDEDADIKHGKVMNRRQQVSKKGMEILEAKIMADHAVQAAGLCP